MTSLALLASRNPTHRQLRVLPSDHVLYIAAAALHGYSLRRVEHNDKSCVCHVVRARLRGRNASDNPVGTNVAWDGVHHATLASAIDALVQIGQTVGANGS